jgi:acyl-CoA thioesterase I
MRSMLRYLYLLILVFACHTPAAAQPQPVILVFGDSLSAGYGLPENTGWVALLQRRLDGMRLGYRVVNASVSGDTTAGGLNRMNAALAQHRPRIVIVELGGNDGLRGAPPAAMRDNLDKLVTAIRRSGAQVLLVGVELPPNYGKRYNEKFRAVYAELAAKYTLPLVPSLLQGFGQDRTLFQADGIHPTREAQPRILENVWRGLAPLFN